MSEEMIETVEEARILLRIARRELASIRAHCRALISDNRELRRQLDEAHAGADA
jgi:hypothetical protein